MDVLSKKTLNDFYLDYLSGLLLNQYRFEYLKAIVGTRYRLVIEAMGFARAHLSNLTQKNSLATALKAMQEHKP